MGLVSNPGRGFYSSQLSRQQYLAETLIGAGFLV